MNQPDNGSGFQFADDGEGPLSAWFGTIDRMSEVWRMNQMLLAVPFNMERVSRSAAASSGHGLFGPLP